MCYFYGPVLNDPLGLVEAWQINEAGNDLVHAQVGAEKQYSTLNERQFAVIAPCGLVGDCSTYTYYAKNVVAGLDFNLAYDEYDDCITGKKVHQGIVAVRARPAFDLPARGHQMQRRAARLAGGRKPLRLFRGFALQPRLLIGGIDLGKPGLHIRNLLASRHGGIQGSDMRAKHRNPTFPERVVLMQSGGDGHGQLARVPFGFAALLRVGQPGDGERKAHVQRARLQRRADSYRAAAQPEFRVHRLHAAHQRAAVFNIKAILGGFRGGHPAGDVISRFPRLARVHDQVGMDCEDSVLGSNRDAARRFPIGEHAAQLRHIKNPNAAVLQPCVQLHLGSAVRHGDILAASSVDSPCVLTGDDIAARIGIRRDYTYVIAHFRQRARRAYARKSRAQNNCLHVLPLRLFHL